MRTIRLRENSANPIGALGLVDAEVDMLVPSLVAAGFVRGLVWSSSYGRAIQTTSTVGVVRIDGPVRFQVEVAPKFGNLATFDMLHALWHLGSNVEIPTDEQIAPQVDTEDFHDMFISWALRRLVGFIDTSLRRDYRRVDEEIQGQVRGRLLVDLWSQNLVSGRPLAVPCRRFEYDLDTQHNRVIRAGLDVISRYLADFGRHHDSRIPQCRAALARMAEVRAVRIRSNDIFQIRYNRLTEHYRPMHQLSALLIRNRSGGCQELSARLAIAG